MQLNFYRLVSLFVLAALSVSLAPARGADDVEMIKEKLYQAKKEYDGEVRKFRKGVGEFLAKREETARNAGNKKLVDQVKAEQEAFEKLGELPAKLPSTLQDQLRNARIKLDKAYTTAIKAYVQAKEDAAAEAAEKEQQKFISDFTIQYGKRTYLSSLKASDVKVWNDWFEKDSTKAKKDGKIVPHSILMHPDSKTYSNASYNLDRKALIFSASVGIPDHEQIDGNPRSALTFEVLGDGKSLWKSEPVGVRASFQTCTIRVDKVKTLTLRIHCPDHNGCAHGTWFTPYIVE